MWWHRKAASFLFPSQGLAMPYIQILKAHTWEASLIPSSTSLAPTHNPSLVLLISTLKAIHFYFLQCQSFAELPLFPLHCSHPQICLPTLLLLCSLRDLFKCQSGSADLISTPPRSKIFFSGFQLQSEILNSGLSGFVGPSPHHQLPASSGSLCPLSTGLQLYQPRFSIFFLLQASSPLQAFTCGILSAWYWFLPHLYLLLGKCSPQS